MKKLTALLLALVMLFSATALAESADWIARNIKLAILEEVIDLSDLEIQLSAAQEGDVEGLRLSLSYKDEPFSNIILARDGSRLILTADALSNAYSLDLGLLAPLVEVTPAEEEAPETQAKVQIVLNEADAAALAELWTNWSANLATAITDKGAEEADGVVTQTYAFAFTAEMVDELALGLCDILDSHPELTEALAANTGVETLRQLYEAVDVALRAEGTLTMNESCISMDADVYAAQADQAEERLHATLCISLPVEENGLDILGVDLFLSAFDAADALVDHLHMGASLSVDVETGALYSMEGTFSMQAADTDGNLRLQWCLSAPLAREDGLWSLEISDSARTSVLAALWGNKNGAATFDLTLTEADNTQLQLFCQETAENACTVRFAMLSDEGEVSLTADMAVETAESADWLPPKDMGALDLASLNEEQMQLLQSESAIMLGNLVLGVIGSSEELMAMMEEMEAPAIDLENEQAILLLLQNANLPEAFLASHESVCVESAMYDAAGEISLTNKSYLAFDVYKLWIDSVYFALDLLTDEMTAYFPNEGAYTIFSDGENSYYNSLSNYQDFAFCYDPEEVVESITEEDGQVIVVTTLPLESTLQLYPAELTDAVDTDEYVIRYVADAQTMELQEVTSVLRHEDGTERLFSTAKFTYDLPEPEAPQAYTDAFTSPGTITVTLVLNPGTDEERTITREQPQSVYPGFYLSEDYETFYLDAECTQPLPSEFSFQEDVTLYVVRGK